MSGILEGRKNQVFIKGNDTHVMECEKKSLAGSVSQRACVFCGSRVVLYPIADAVHIVHGPIGCAAYTWDIRGALSSGPELHRLSFSTDLGEMDIVNGGEKKLYRSLIDLIGRYKPEACFVYSTCIIGIIGDDVDAVCKKVEAETNLPVIHVNSEGFRGTKKDGYKAACDALFNLMSRGLGIEKRAHSINILGDFNIAGEIWMIKEYYKKMGIEVVATITGDGRVSDIMKAGSAALNVVQCSGSMVSLANMMEEKYLIPFIRVSYFGLEDMAKALYDVADFFGDENIKKRSASVVKEEMDAVLPELRDMRMKLEGKKAAIYVGGAFKAMSLVSALRMLGMKTSVIGTQTGNKDDYESIKEMCDDDTVIVDDTNPVELAGFIKEKGIDLFIGGVKERPIAFKLGIGFCDHNHERKLPLAGFAGMLNFSREVYRTVSSPVWDLVPKKKGTDL